MKSSTLKAMWIRLLIQGWNIIFYFFFYIKKTCKKQKEHSQCKKSLKRTQLNSMLLGGLSLILCFPKLSPLSFILHSSIGTVDYCFIFSERKYIFLCQNWSTLNIIYLKTSKEGINQADAHMSKSLNYLNIKQAAILQLFLFPHYGVFLPQSEVIKSANY